VALGQQQQFTATVSGASNSAVTWSVLGGASNGAISNTGLYTPPGAVPNPAQVTVQATSQADATKFGQAVVTLTSASTAAVTVSPANADVETFTAQQFNAMVNGQASTAVTWQVNGVTGGNPTVGQISSSGFYVAPHAISNTIIPKNAAPVTVQITAISTANASNFGNATVTLTLPNQNAQNAPVVLGSSGGNVRDSTTNKGMITCCGGTLGSLVSRGGTKYILSNNHVLARSDAATAGESIIEPSLIDTGSCTSSGALPVATLTQFFDFIKSPGNRIDAAIAAVDSGAVNPNGNIYLIGDTLDGNGVPLPGAPKAGTGIAGTVGMGVAKSGRTTGLTCSTISATDVATVVTYTANCDGSGSSFPVNYSNQISINGGDFSGGGDSGSLVVSQTTADPVALLYAGSDTDTVANPVGDVLNFFSSGSSPMTFVGGGAHKVAGCTGPFAHSGTSTVIPQAMSSTVPAEAIKRVAALRDTHAPDLMARPEMRAVGIGASFDNPREPAVVLFVARGTGSKNLPAQIEGVRTRIVESDSDEVGGALTAEESMDREMRMPARANFRPVSEAEKLRAKTVHSAHVSELLGKPGIQGVGITSSADAPGEAALMIFVIRGVPHDPIPAMIDGIRTRVRESSRFKAGVDALPHRGCRVPVSPFPATKSATKVGVVSLPAKP
jgi:hypothetical protein